MTLSCSTLGLAIAGAIAEDTDIISACQTLWTKNHTVYYGSSGREGPPIEDFPAFQVLPWGKDTSESADDRSFTMVILLAIEDTSITTTDADEETAKTVVHRGPTTLETLLDLAVAAARAISNEIFFSFEEQEYEVQEFFPIFLGQVALTITYPVLIGGYEPTIT